MCQTVDPDSKARRLIQKARSGIVLSERNRHKRGRALTSPIKVTVGVAGGLLMLLVRRNRDEIARTVFAVGIADKHEQAIDR